jgi:MFS family permease
VRDGPPGLWSPLRHKDFALLWGGFVVSHVGDFVQVLAQSWLVVDLTRSAAKVAAVAFAQALPRFFITLFAGVIVDRVDRRRLLLTTQLLAAAQSAVFLVLLPEPLRFIEIDSSILGPMRQLLYAVILFAIVWWKRKTIFPEQREV